VAWFFMNIECLRTNIYGRKWLEEKEEKIICGNYLMAS
jgi:hypothetical protein